MREMFIMFHGKFEHFFMELIHMKSTLNDEIMMKLINEYQMKNIKKVIHSIRDC